MTERRFRVDAALVAGARVSLPAAVGKHVRVLRLAVGDRVVLFDGAGREADAVLLDGLDARVEEVRAVVEPWSVVLVLGLPRALKLDDVLRGVAEVGASEVRLFVAARSVSNPEEGRLGHKRERWRRILEEAARQSERARVPTLTGPTSLEEALAELPGGARLVALDAREGVPIDAALGPPGVPIVLVIGPEGGLAPDELAILDRRGAIRARAALPVLRVETAAVVFTALGVLHARR
ncbi:MAG: 16S rRNA (uracil(1498)-N(3))-methyltransferase [Sandaracinaceae bacterium]